MAEVAKIATFVRDIEGWRGDAKLYKVDPPMKSDRYFDEDNETYEYVIVSAADLSGLVHAMDSIMGAPIASCETYIFPATEDGEAVNYGELPGSFKGSKDHEQALKNAGYEVVEGEINA